MRINVFKNYAKVAHATSIINRQLSFHNIYDQSDLYLDGAKKAMRLFTLQSDLQKCRNARLMKIADLLQDQLYTFPMATNGHLNILKQFYMKNGDQEAAEHFINFY